MNSTRRSFATFFVCLFSLLCVSMASAQQESPATTQSSVPIVTATASHQRVRYASLGEVHQTRLQVFSATGEQVYDSGLRLGNLIDWKLQDQQGQALSAGSYLYLITVKDFSERLTQKYGTAVLEREQVYLEQPGRAELPQLQAATLEANRQSESLSLVDRVGAAGLSSASSTSTEGVSATGTEPSGTDNVSAIPTTEENATGSGSQNYLARWTDNAGTLGNSTLFQNAGRIGLGTVTPGANFHVVGTQGTVGAGTFQLDTPITFGSWSGAYPAFEIVNANQTNNNVSLFQFSDAPSGASHAGIGAVNTNHANKWGNLFFYTKQADGYQIRMGIYGGNVGIGTTTPDARLHVEGNSIFTGNVTISGILSANLPVGDTDYIQNRTTTQASSNFNISGNGIVGGAMRANSFNSDTVYKIGSNTVLNANVPNTFVGIGAGLQNSGTNNSFFGYGAGSITTGNNNSFFGKGAGVVNQGGTDNSFFGVVSGDANTTGSNNSFFGSDAGGANNTGNDNSFFGSDAGDSNTSGFRNSFFGRNAGQANTAGGSNSFFGTSAGQANADGSLNSYFGYEAGFATSTGAYNAFFGYGAGRNVTNSVRNSFFGHLAGGSAAGGGNENSFFGSQAGLHNTSGGLNTFLGYESGNSNGTGSWNTFVGAQAGDSNTTGIGNTYVGYLADGASDLVNATAIGNRAKVTQSNSIVLGSINGVNGAGSDTLVGIGTTNPLVQLHVNGDLYVRSIILRNQTGTKCVLLAGTDDGTLEDVTDYNCPSTPYSTSISSSDKSIPNNSMASQTTGDTTLTLAPTNAGDTNLNREGVARFQTRSMMAEAIKQQQEQIKQQQKEIESLKHLVCLDHPEAKVCAKGGL